MLQLHQKKIVRNICACVQGSARRFVPFSPLASESIDIYMKAKKRDK